MPVWLVKLLVTLMPEPKEAIKYLFVLILLPIALIILVFGTPVFALKFVPMTSPDHVQMYIEAASNVSNGKDVKVDWRNVVAIDTVLLQQDFEKASLEEAEHLANRFIRVIEVEEEYEEIDPETNETVVKTRIIEVYELKTLDEVISELINEGQLSEEQREEVFNYLQFDLSKIQEEYCDIPADWVPVEGQFKWPLQGYFEVTSKFGLRIDPFENRDEFHTGIDIAGPFRTKIVAANDGTIIRASYSSRGGNVVVIDHGNGRETRYYHMDTSKVTEGQKVKKGDLIGLEGNTGRSTGPHLHFEIRINGEAVNPILYFK